MGTRGQEPVDREGNRLPYSRSAVLLKSRDSPDKLWSDSYPNPETPPQEICPSKLAIGKYRAQWTRRDGGLT